MIPPYIDHSVQTHALVLPDITTVVPTSVWHVIHHVQHAHQFQSVQPVLMLHRLLYQVNVHVHLVNISILFLLLVSLVVVLVLLVRLLGLTVHHVILVHRRGYYLVILVCVQLGIKILVLLTVLLVLILV